MSVAAEVRYLNAEWQGRAETPVVGDRDSRRANTTKHPVEIHDARGRLANGELTLDVNGFCLLRHTSGVRNFGDDDEVRRIYYPEIVALAKRTTGARDVLITQHVVRTEDTSDFNRAYARFLHCDYTLDDPRGLAERALARHGLDSNDYATSEFAWFNSWQPFDHTVERNPLAVRRCQHGEYRGCPRLLLHGLRPEGQVGDAGSRPPTPFLLRPANEDRRTVVHQAVGYAAGLLAGLSAHIVRRSRLSRRRAAETQHRSPDDGHIWVIFPGFEIVARCCATRGRATLRD